MPEIKNINKRISQTLQSIETLQFQGKTSSKEASSESKMTIDPIRLKKMKSTLPDVGKLKSELQQENDKLRKGVEWSTQVQQH
jgi:hypothetical protein